MSRVLLYSGRWDGVIVCAGGERMRDGEWGSRALAREGKLGGRLLAAGTFLDGGRRWRGTPRLPERMETPGCPDWVLESPLSHALPL